MANADFRKYDDGLRMTVDCGPDLAARIEARLEAAEAAGAGAVRLHRQAAALTTCITPVAALRDHVHFVDGEDGGYARAAQALKAKDAARVAAATAKEAALAPTDGEGRASRGRRGSRSRIGPGAV